jgi:L-amino acid N-acyltransferase YncA
VTSGAEIDNWTLEIASGATITVIAAADGEVLGESSLHRTDVPWTRHVGIIRVVIHPQQRGRGLARLLLGEVCAVAIAAGIERLVAEMTAEQTGALALFAGLGFVQEGRYRAFARDMHGDLHDLIVMTAGRPEMERLVQAAALDRS